MGHAMLPGITALTALAQLAPGPSVPAEVVDPPRNVLVVVLDDVGVDDLACYGLGPDQPLLPTIDGLAGEGLRFENAWANPVCSSTRAALQTGRHSFRTGMGHTVEHGAGSLPLAEVTLPELLDLATGGGVAHAAFGKWHLGDEAVGGADGPNLAGYGHFAGTLSNVKNYTIYERVVDGASSWHVGYATSDTVDDAIAWLRDAPEPFLGHVAFHAGHQPWHAPPPGLYHEDLSQAGPVAQDPRPYYKAMLEALDTELRRLLDALEPGVRARTTVILIGDNGTPGAVVPPQVDPSKAKTTLFEGGIHVPLIVSGAGVPAQGRSSRALVHAVDVFTTAADLLGVDASSALAGVELDGHSLVPYLAEPGAPPVRAKLYAEVFIPNGWGPFHLRGRAARNERFKLVLTYNTGGTLYQTGLYDLERDPDESWNLLLSRAPLTPLQVSAYNDLLRSIAVMSGAP